jgi:hypothetical protein
MARGAFAAGKKALGICDRCGWTWKLDKLKSEQVNLTNNHLSICPDCWDPDHPQNMQGRIDYSDPQALRNPSPDSSKGTSPIDLYHTTASYNWEFDTNELGREDDYDSTMDWMPEGSGTLTWNSAGSPGTQDGTATLVTAGSDEGMTRETSALLNSRWFESNDYDFARIRMKVTIETRPEDWAGIFHWRRSFDGVGQYKGIAHARPGSVKQMGDQWFILEYDLNAEPLWSGRIRELRFVPYSTAGNTVEIDYIRLEKK